jgi:UDP-glucose 4-epimerase
MKVIITGASGFIGRNVLERVPPEWDVVAVYRRESDFEEFVARLGAARVTPIRCDLLDASAVQRVAEAVGGRADAVLYLAANGDPAVSAERPRWDLESNSVALVNFMEHCPAGHVVFVSSGAVYDGAIGPVTPATPVTPHLPYAISKLAAEHYLRFFTERRRSIESSVTVRFFGAYGPYEPERKITTRFVRAVMNGDSEFTVRGSGENFIDFMHVDDAVRVLLALVAARGTSCTLDVASGAPLTVNELVAAMSRALGAPMRIRHVGRTDEFIQFRSVDTTMRERFGIVPRIGLDEGLKDLARSLGGGSDAAAARPGLAVRDGA